MGYLIGLDLGGTNVKGGVFSTDGQLIYTDKWATDKKTGVNGTIKQLSDFSNYLVEKIGGSFFEVEGIGVGVPGVIDSENGIVLRWSNFNWTNVPFAEELSHITHKKTVILNDANAAALGEAKFGASSQYQSSIFLTIGTGIGGGIVFDGKLIEGYKCAGAELGHITIREGGLPCSCGRKGCYEKYASATALILQTKHAMVENAESIMWEITEGDLRRVDGRTAFVAAKRGDETALNVVRNFVGYLAEGIADFVNILRPEAIVLGGGIANEGEFLFDMVRKAVDKRSYIAMDIVPLKIVGAQLGNKAGIYGAYCLVKDC